LAVREAVAEIREGEVDAVLLLTFVDAGVFQPGPVLEYDVGVCLEALTPSSLMTVDFNLHR
jgi:hypothetical protein